ncbi:uncharacterized protein LOC113854808 [Abrus precatorius]|uniref:Uncharacterized protein LOC113854808 n=1 Tax=Abrus precatorius TaxID=3816 RepID=A0A8B8KFX0_ABRPR|nr:uncharacterized protein LOC113854808 [Abrus precatorius]
MDVHEFLCTSYVDDEIDTVTLDEVGQMLDVVEQAGRKEVEDSTSLSQSNLAPNFDLNEEPTREDVSVHEEDVYKPEPVYDVLPMQRSMPINSWDFTPQANTQTSTMEPSKNNTQTEEDDTIALKKKRARRVSFADNEITSVHVFRRDDDDSSSTDTPADPSVLGNSFLRAIGSPSPGGSSTADNGDGDEDFHGPVSACFIRPDRLSDSGASDDVTMDSTAFSLHYRSLARSDSGDIKTRQFGLTTPSSHGSSMDLTEGRKLCEVLAADVESGGRDSNDMSIEGEHVHSYHYDRLSPALDAILAGGSKGSPNVSVKVADSSIASPVNQVHQIQAFGSPIKQIEEFAKDSTVPICRQLGFANANRGTPVKVDEDRGQVFDSNRKSDQVNQNPVHGSTPLSFSGSKQLFTSSPGSSRYAGNIIPPLEQSGKFGPEVCVTSDATPSSVHKSISKMKILETTPSMSSLKEGIDILKGRLSKYSPGFSLSNKKDKNCKQVQSRKIALEKKLFSFTPENNMHKGVIDSNDCGIHSFRNISKLSQNEETVDTKNDEENLNLISAYASYNDDNPMSVAKAASPLQMAHLTRVVDVDQADSVVEKRKGENLVVMHDKPFSLPVKLFDQNLSPSVECQSNCRSELKQVEKQNDSVSSGLGQTVECNSHPVANKLEFSGLGNNKQPNSPFGVAHVNGFAKSASERTSANSPNRILVLSTPIRKVTKLSSLQEPSGIQDISPNDNSDGHGLDYSYHLEHFVAQGPLTKSGIEISSGKKRKGVEIPSDGNTIDKIARIRRSPELVLEQTGRSEKEKLGDQTWNDWDHILKKFLASTNQLFSPVVDELNLRLIGRLEDTLVHLQKAKKLKILCSEIDSQHKITDPLNICSDKRVAETRILLYNLAYEKAKLQLMHMKRERLLKKVQQLSSGLQESEVIKLNLVPSSSKSGAMDTQAGDSVMHTALFSSHGKCQVSCKKVMEMKQELETLDSKAKSLREFLYRYCKMDGDRSCASSMKSVSGYLQKRMTCKSIFQNLKLWDIEDFELRDDCYRVFLNYCGYITQRVAVNTGLSSLLISNKLNDVNIGKTFPNLDAFSAFVFVLNPHTAKKCTGLISMARETQITSSLLSNLLDVIEEVQSARIEIRNLVEGKFYSYSVQQLDLQLSFIDFCNGGTVKVTLDMSCLQCGAYPVDVLPSQIFDSYDGEQKSFPSSLADEIRTAAQSVRVGYSRIVRLCRCISQAVQACTQSR